jgi:hypothetical protein
MDAGLPPPAPTWGEQMAAEQALAPPIFDPISAAMGAASVSRALAYAVGAAAEGALTEGVSRAAGHVAGEIATEVALEIAEERLNGADTQQTPVAHADAGSVAGVSSGDAVPDFDPSQAGPSGVNDAPGQSFTPADANWTDPEGMASIAPD